MVLLYSWNDWIDSSKQEKLAQLKANVADRPVRRIYLRAALLSTMTNESIYFNHHESYYNKITIKRYFDGLGIYERYV